ETVRKEIRAGIEAEATARAVAFDAVGQGEEGRRHTAELLEQLEADMMQAAAELDFERAAHLRDRIADLRDGRGRDGRRIGKGPRPRGPGRIPRPKRT
ncbi:MAG: excinuclease ABC subunit B, partial [Planctomycetia bacterium]|nr:excinuclease ABC subunit B [Planctomycetia bacterium]